MKQKTKDDEENILALIKVKQLEHSIKYLKNISVQCMGLTIKTIKSVDENSKKMLFKHFDSSCINHLSYKTPIFISQLRDIAR